MPLAHKFVPLVVALVGLVALMAPTPTPGMSIAELSPLPTIANIADLDGGDQADAAMAVARAQAVAALLDLQAAGH